MDERTLKVRGWKEDEVEGVEGRGRSEDGRTLKVRWTGLFSSSCSEGQNIVKELL